MKNAGSLYFCLKPAYNVQIGVESEYVVGVGIFQDRNDIATLIPMLETISKKPGRKYTNVIADSGYESEENYLYLEENQQTPYIKPQTNEKWKKKSFKKEIRKQEIYVLQSGDRYLYLPQWENVKTKGHRTPQVGYRIYFGSGSV